MADIERMKSALVNAHKAGDIVAAKKIANAIKAAQPSSAPQSGDIAAQRDKYYSSGIFAGDWNPLGPMARTLDAGARGIESGITAGFNDEMGLTPQNEKEAIRAESPIASTVGELAGGLTVGGGLASKGVTLAGRNIPLIGRTGGAVLEGAAYGGIHGAGEAQPGERLEGAKTGALAGAITGGVLSRAGDFIANTLARKSAKGAMPDIETLQAKAGDLYDAMRNSGVVVKAPKVQHLQNNVGLVLRETTPDLSPKAYALKELIERDLKGNVGIKELHNVSKSVNRVARSALDGEDGHFVGRVKDIVDGMIHNMKATDLNGPIGAVRLKRYADALWKQSSKSEIVENLVEQARNQATGFENGLVIKFRALANNKKQMRMFSSEEQALIKDLVRRGSARGILKGLGMLSPTSTFGGIVAGATGVGTGIMPAAMLGGAGFAAKKGAEALTRSKADFIRGAVRTGRAPKLGGTQKTVPFVGGTSGLLASQANRPR